MLSSSSSINCWYIYIYIYIYIFMCILVNVVDSTVTEKYKCVQYRWKNPNIND